MFGLTRGYVREDYEMLEGSLSKMRVCLGWIIGSFSYTRGGLRETRVKVG